MEGQGIRYGSRFAAGIFVFRPSHPKILFITYYLYFHKNKIPGGENSQQVIDIIPLVQLNKEVQKITYNQPDGNIKIDCKDGSTYSADHLICTVSLGVLKDRHLDLFEPMLSLTKFDAIDGMMIGTVDKIYLEFDKPFWSSDWPGFSALWNRKEIKEVREDAVNGDWLEGLMGFYPFNELQPNMLCGWVVGPLARIMEQKSDADVKAGVEKVLRLFLKDQNVPDAKAMIRYGFDFFMLVDFDRRIQMSLFSTSVHDGTRIRISVARTHVTH